MQKGTLVLITLYGLLILGLILMIALLFAEISGSILPREQICPVPPLHQGGVGNVWDRIVQETGIDAETATLTRAAVEIRPDDSISTVKIEFNAISGGQERKYLVWYLEDHLSCGWIDGLTYPEQLPGDQRPLHPDPRRLVEEVGKIRLADLNLSGHNVRIWSDTSSEPADSGPVARALGEFNPVSGDATDLRKLIGDDNETSPLFLIHYDRLDCTKTREGIIHCDDDRAAQVVSGPVPLDTNAQNATRFSPGDIITDGRITAIIFSLNAIFT